ncbi:hypothetical protein G4Z16_06945 [Streptomyces bathyalis]|uniref:Uncharacterized protein n=1 Tax=Streptomyces bathyalis TaxID=2710756 RepID=A0A7T1WSW2_9ACTN|nr:hypothetical protein [Streptomyces bathyalis]QPP06175.1 hypothetical protein G4Z16_06945 [Streptomyces bathyalis]
MPLTPEEPQIQESAPGSRNSAAATRTPQASRPAAPIPGPRAPSRPTPPRADRKGPTPARPGSVRSGSQRASAAPARTSAAIELVTATDTTAVDVADETVDKLLDEGTAPGDVLVITTGEQHPWAQHELSFGEDAYWRQLADAEDVFCVHTSATSRVTRRGVVVLAVNGGTDAQAAEALPAALAKAGRSLIVVGDPQRLRQLL